MAGALCCAGHAREPEDPACQCYRPLGRPLTLESLPPPGTRRWVVRRKAEVVAAVQGGLLTFDEACERYDLTLQELVSCERAVDLTGMQGLRVTRLQHYRALHERRIKHPDERRVGQQGLSPWK